jgi:hypothetical protein
LLHARYAGLAFQPPATYYKILSWVLTPFIARHAWVAVALIPRWISVGAALGTLLLVGTSQDQKTTNWTRILVIIGIITTPIFWRFGSGISPIWPIIALLVLGIRNRKWRPFAAVSLLMAWGWKDPMPMPILDVMPIPSLLLLGASLSMILIQIRHPKGHRVASFFILLALVCTGGTPILYPFFITAIMVGWIISSQWWATLSRRGLLLISIIIGYSGLLSIPQTTSAALQFHMNPHYKTTPQALPLVHQVLASPQSVPILVTRGIIIPPTLAPHPGQIQRVTQPTAIIAALSHPHRPLWMILDKSDPLFSVSHSHRPDPAVVEIIATILKPAPSRQIHLNTSQLMIMKQGDDSPPK